jgi:hypothetical protein
MLDRAAEIIKRKTAEYAAENRMDLEWRIDQIDTDNLYTAINEIKEILHEIRRRIEPESEVKCADR